MPNSTDSCLAAIHICKRCCYGTAQYFLQDFVWLNDSCVQAHDPINLNSGFFHNQILNYCTSIFSLCDSSRILPCPGNGSIFMSISYAPCYHWSTPYYNVVTGYTEDSLIACTDTVGCVERYKACWNGTNIVWTYVDQAYSAICPTQPFSVTCFSICRED
jgi:hypothetical protein